MAHGLLPHNWEARSGREFTIEARRGHLRAAIDGEADVLETPLRFGIEPRALRLLLPPER
jgi:diacylglycerol kinase family enzyme